MSEDLICPDCGGVIGGEPGLGRQVCRCFEPSRSSVAATALSESIEGASVSSPSSTGEKLCRVCGRDLKGHRRLKDSRGYVCVKCDAEEKRLAEVAEAQDLSLITCPECKRKLKVDGMTTYMGAVMCKKCAAETKELNKYKAPPIAMELHKDVEKRSLRNLLIVLGVLAVIILLASSGWIGRH